MIVGWAWLSTAGLAAATFGFLVKNAFCAPLPSVRSFFFREGGISATTSLVTCLSLVWI